MEHSQFIDDYGLPAIAIMCFISGIAIGLNLAFYWLKNKDGEQ